MWAAWVWDLLTDPPRGREFRQYPYGLWVSGVALSPEGRHLAVGREDSGLATNEQLSGNLWRHGIGNALRVWDGWSHDWPYWARMLTLYVGGHD